MAPSFEGRGPLNGYRLTAEWAEWLATFPWTHFETLTFRTERFSARACWKAVAAYQRRLSRRSIGHRCIAVVEGEASTRMHVHTLAMCHWQRGPHDDRPRPPWMVPEPLHRTLHREWFEAFGRARISPLGSDRIGAGFYVAKYLMKASEPRWDFLPSHGWDRIVRA